MEGTMKIRHPEQTRTTPRQQPAGHPTFHRAPAKSPKRSTGILDCYLREIQRNPVLTREEEIEIGRRAQSGDAVALNRLVESNLRFVVKIAREYATYGLPVEDLINEGNIGLLEAAERFDPERGVKFISWAVWWIRKSIRTALNEQLRVVRLPLSQIRKIRVVRETERGLQKDLGREPTSDEIVAKLPKALTHLEPIHRHDVRITSIDEPIAGTFRETLADVLDDPHHPSIESEMLDREAVEVVNSLCRQLDERQQTVISYRFGLNGKKRQTLREIGERIGLTRESVRQIECQAIKQLRRRMLSGNLGTPRPSAAPSSGLDSAA
jgi:RNA polymerase primary sigma factor